jgi:hypothetical protein
VPIEILEQLGISIVRIPALRSRDDGDYIARLRRRHIDVIVTCTRESFDGFGATNEHRYYPAPETQVAAFAEYGRRYGGQVYGWQIGHEPDGGSKAGSWPMPWVYLNGLMRRARETLGQHAYLIGPGLVSGNAEWIRGLDLRWIDALAIHPYGQGTVDYPSPIGLASDIGRLFDAYQSVLDEMHVVGMDLQVTEFGAQSGVLGDLGQAAYIEALARWLRSSGRVGNAIQFCLTDLMAPTFGLIRADETWSPKPAFARFQRVGRWDPTSER